MVQALRAAACLLVVLYHTVQASRGEAAIRAWPNGAAGVDLFFVISGYVMVASTRRLATQPHAARRFVSRRALRIVPLYWLLTAVKYAITRAAPAATPHTQATAWNLLGSLLFIPSRNAAGLIRPVLPVGWSLNFEAAFYALFALSLALRLRVWWLLVPLTAAAAAGFFQADTWPAPLALANGMALEFAAGMLVWACAMPLPRRPAGAVLATGAALLLVLPQAGAWRFAVWGLPSAAVLLGALAMEAAWGRYVPRLLLALGDASYAIYLVHPFVVPVVARHGWLGLLASVPLSAGAGLAVHRWLDEPMRQALSRGTRPRAVPLPAPGGS
jgi:peptidoglycan/LPS O-acetylase OafA/YrhL